MKTLTLVNQFKSRPQGPVTLPNGEIVETYEEAWERAEDPLWMMDPEDPFIKMSDEQVTQLTIRTLKEIPFNEKGTTPWETLDEEGKEYIERAEEALAGKEFSDTIASEPPRSIEIAASKAIKFAVTEEGKASARKIADMLRDIGNPFNGNTLKRA